MPVGWFLCPYKVGSSPRDRYCAMNDFTAAIWADNGYPQGNVPGSPEFWSETEVLGNHAIVKVRASAPLLATIAAEPGFTRFPKDALGTSLSDLTNAQKLALRDLVEGLGYSRAEWRARLGDDLGAVTLRQVLRFIATRRRKPRFDEASQAIVLDGDEQPCRDLDVVDAAV